MACVLTSHVIEDIGTAQDMADRLTSANVGNIYRYTGATTTDYKNGGYYKVAVVSRIDVDLSQIGSYYVFENSNRRTVPEGCIGFWQSTNYNINSSKAVCKISFFGVSSLTVYINSYAESNYDYTILSKLDASAIPAAYNDDRTQIHTRGFQKDPTGALNTNYKSYTFETDGGEHFFYVVYTKDGSAHSSDDRGYFTIESNVDALGFEEYVHPIGNIDITDTSVYDVSDKKTAQVNEGNLLAGNIRAGVTVLGVLGTYGGGGGGSGYKVYFISNCRNPDGGTLEHNNDGNQYLIVKDSGGTTSYAILSGIESLTINHFDHWGGDSWGAWRPHASDWQTWLGAGGTQITGGKTGTTLAVTQDIDLVIVSGTCLTGDMLILMADGTEQRVDTIHVGDMVMTPNGAREVTFSDSDVEQYGDAIDHWYFEDIEIKTINPHRFYNVERGAFIYLHEWKIGEHTINDKGEEIRLTGHLKTKDRERHYTIFTEEPNCYYVNGLLSGNRFSKVSEI